jgi:hypothetical protein
MRSPTLTPREKPYLGSKGEPEEMFDLDMRRGYRTRGVISAPDWLASIGSMRFRISPALGTVLVVMAVAASFGPLAMAQDLQTATEEMENAARRAEVASGLVDEAVANRAEIEAQLADSIAKANDLAAALSVVGASLDRLADRVGLADAELAGIQTQIEVQAVDAYMTALSSPSLSLVGTGSVEHALVVSTVVEDVVSSGRAKAGELFIKRRSLEELQQVYLSQLEEYTSLQDQVNVEVDRLVALYDEADASVADLVRRSRQADAEYRATLTTVELARVRVEESDRQESRSPTTTTTPPGTTTPSTTSPPAPTTTSGGSGGGPWNHPSQVERWRPLVAEFFPAHRVEEALAIIDCESKGDPDAYNPYSGASGLFQFLPSTWASTAPKAGYSEASVFDPEANIATAAWLASRYQELGQDYWRAWSCRRILN